MMQNVNNKSGTDLYSEMDNKDMLIHSQFEKQVQKTPDNVAIVYNNKEYTYSELNRKANCIARKLRASGIRPDDLVTLMVDRSFDMIAAQLGIMKSGAAYIPLDPDYPANRIKFILEDSSSRALVTNSTSHRDFGIDGLDIILIDQIDESDQNSVDLPIVNRPDNLAYVIYTSGSTGTPKGVMIEHKSIINTLLWRKSYYGMSQKDATLQIPSISFDSSVEDIFTPLLSGARLVLIQNELKLSISYLRNVIAQNVVTNMLVVPSLYQIFLAEMADTLKNFRFITVAGEHFSQALVDLHFQKLPNVALFNEYGPTENSVCTTVYKFDPTDTEVLIGKPIHNVHCYVLDEYLQPVAFNTEGELCISGAGLARGYLNHPDITKEHFVEVPFQPGRILYKTGDRVVCKSDENMQFIGRLDQQIKINGHRIELHEIEHLLNNHPEIKNSAVVVGEDNSGQKAIHGYCVATSNISSAEIGTYLRDSIPDYMVPSKMIFLDKLPTLPNGKIDRQSLVNRVASPDSVCVKQFHLPCNSDQEETIESRIITVLRENIELPVTVDEECRSTTLKNHGLSSVSYILLIVSIETEFDLEFTQVELEAMDYGNASIHSLVSVITEKLAV